MEDPRMELGHELPAAKTETALQPCAYCDLGNQETCSCKYAKSLREKHPQPTPELFNAHVVRRGTRGGKRVRNTNPKDTEQPASPETVQAALSAMRRIMNRGKSA